MKKHENIDKHIRGIITDFTCGFCSAQHGYEIAFSGHSEWYGTYGDLWAGRAIATAECRNCSMYNLFIFRVEEDDHEFEMDEQDLQFYLEANPDVIYSGWHPLSKGDYRGLMSPTRLRLLGQYPYGNKLNDDLPEGVLKDLREAGNCLAVGAVNAASVMCRRVIENLAEHFGLKPETRNEKLERLKNEGHINEVAIEELSTEITLYKQLEELKNQGRLDDTLYEALSESRRWGNLGAHAGEKTMLNQRNAEQLVQLVIEAVEYAFSKQRLQNLTSDLAERRKPNKPQ